MPTPVIWPRHAWKRKTFEEIEVLISNWPKNIQLKWWKEESEAYRRLLQIDLARRTAKKRPRPRPHHSLIEAVLAYTSFRVGYSQFWPLAKEIFDSRPGDFSGVSDVNPEKRYLEMTSADGQKKYWRPSKEAVKQLMKRTRKRLRQ